MLKSAITATLMIGVAGVSATYLAAGKIAGTDPAAVEVIPGRQVDFASAAALPSSQGSTAAAAAAPSGCMSKSTSLPWGDLAYRNWSPVNNLPNEGTPANAGIRTGSPFSARLVRAYGLDTEFSRRTAILELPDGCRRQYQVQSFSSGDVAYITGQINQHPAASDPSNYVASIAEEGNVSQAQIDSGQVKTYQTQHFNLMYGVATKNVSYTFEASKGVAWQTFLAGAGKVLEDGYQLARDVTGAPMPYAQSPVKKKINVYICGTGLPFIANGDTEDCGASAAQAAYMSSIYLQPGSTTVWHEFAHAIQFYSGGFRGRDAAGPIWETGADWVSFTSSPTIDNSIAYYYSNLENGPLWSFSRYGAYPFKSFLAEKDATRAFVWSTWKNNLRDSNGTSLEDWTQTFVRLAQASGVYVNTYQSFADDMGWYGARLATGDFLNQKALLDLRNSEYVAKLYTPLQATGSAGTYSSPATRQLLQWGTHIIPLTPTGTNVSAVVKGGTSAGSAAWRWAIVTLGPDGSVRYSTLGKVAGTANGSSVSLAPVSNTKMYLVVTATPYAYQSLGWQQAGAVTGNKFPYSVTISGATPLTGSTATCNSVPAGFQGQNLNYNTNGFTDAPKAC